MQRTIYNTNYGSHLSNAPLTTRDTESMSPTILRSEIDERITKIRPTSTPIDQISRLAGSRRAASMKVDYYSVDTKPGHATITTSLPSKDIPSDGSFSVEVDNPVIFSVSETVLFPANKNTAAPFVGVPLVGYIKDVNGNNLIIRPTQIKADAEEITIPAFNSGDRIVRMGRAACELDVQTPQYTAVPKKSFNYCQIFKTKNTQQISNF